MKFKPYEEYKKVDLPWIEEIPSHWEIISNRYLWVERNEKGFINKDLISVTIKNGVLPQSELLKNSSKKDNSNLDKSKYKLVMRNDIVYNTMRMWQGAVGISNYEGIVSPAYIVLEPIKNCNYKYYSFLFRTDEYNNESYRNSYGICDDQLKLRYDEFKVMNNILPPKEEQDKIIEFLDYNLAKIDNFVELTERQIELLKEQKEVLINDAVTKGIDKNVEYKDSGIDWIGEIPKHWEVTRLKHVAKINPSIQADIEDMDFNNQLVFLAMEDISETGELNQSNFKKLKEVKTGYTAFKREDVIVAKITPCFENGKGSYLKKLKTDVGYGTTELVVLRKTDKIYGEYLYKVTKSHLFRKKGEMMMKGSAGQKRITSEFLNSFKLGLPPKKEQEEIVAYIEKETNKIDRTIELYKNQIKLIKEYRTSLIASAVTGKIDVRDL